MRVLILGAGGHAKVVADILQLQGAEVCGFLDDNSDLWNTRILGLPILGSIKTYANFLSDAFVIGIGSNTVRQKLDELLNTNVRWLRASHPTATIARSAYVGKGVVIAAHAVVNPDSFIEDHAIINTAATVDHDCVIGRYAHIAPGTHLAGGVKVGEGAFIGIGANITPGCTIGDWAIVGAGATVVNDVPPRVVAKGIPARWKR